MTTQPDPGLAARPLGRPLVARTVAIDGVGALDARDALLSLLPDLGPRLVSSWVRRGEGLVGWGRAVEFTAQGPQRFADAEAWWRGVVASAVVRDEVGIPGTGPVACGSES